MDDPAECLKKRLAYLRILANMSDLPLKKEEAIKMIPEFEKAIKVLNEKKQIN